MALLSRARVIAERLYSDGCCPACLLKLARDLAADTTALEEARRDLPKLWNDCAFALSFGSMDASVMESMSEDRRAKVRRAQNACALHSASPSPSADILHDFIDAVCACLHFCLSLGESCAVQRAANRKRVFENRAGHWPTWREALFPFGEEFGVPSVLFWCKTMGTPYPLLLLGDMLRISHPLVSFEMQENPELHRKLLLAVMCRLGEYGKWANELGSRARETQSAEDRALLPPVSPQHRKQNMRAAVWLLSSMRYSPDAAPNAFLVLTDGCQDPLFQSLFMSLVALERSDDADAESLCRTVASLCGSLYHYIPTPTTALEICPVILKHVANYDTWSIYRVLLRVLGITARNRRRCSGPECTTVAHQTDWEGDSHFLACGRCKLTRYCSKECQSADWKRGSQVPHRLVCPLIQKMMAVANVDMKPREFEAAVSGLDLQTADLRLLSLFALNPNTLPGEVMIRAADIHRSLMDREQLSEASAKALDNADLIKRIFEAKKAGIPLDDIAAVMGLST